MADFWAAALALNPAMLWKLNETSGSSAADASGNGRTGTYQITPVLNQPSIIPHNPADGCVQLNQGPSYYVHRTPHAAWMAPGSAFSAYAWVVVDNFAAQRDLFGKMNSWQVWIEASGALTFYVTPAWSSVTSSVSLVAGQAHFVCVTKSATEAKIYIDGVLRGTLAHASALSDGQEIAIGYSSSSFRYYPGKAQGFGYMPGVTLTATQVADLFAGSTGNAAPTAPGAVTVPTAGSEVDASVNVAWGVSTDPNGDAITYYGEWSADGAVWNLLFTWQAALSYNWNTAALPYKKTYRVRVKAKDAPGLESGWTTSGIFTIRHASQAPAAPVIAVRNVTDWSVELDVTNAYSDPDAGPHYATQWQLDVQAGTFSAPVYDVEDLSVLLDRWITGLPTNTSLKARARFIDTGGQLGAWSNVVEFKTRKLNQAVPVDFRAHKARDLSGNGKHGDYGNISGDLISMFALGAFPEIPVKAGGQFQGLAGQTDRGARFRLYNAQGAYDQVPNQYKQLIRVNGEDFDQQTWSMMVILEPNALGAKAEIAGAPGQWFLWHDTTGTVRFTGGNTGPCGGGNTNYVVAAEVLIPGQRNLILFAHQPGNYIISGLCLDQITGTAPIFRLGVNGTYSGGARAVTCLGSTLEGCPNPRIIGYEDFDWLPSTYIDVGHGSTNAIESADAWGDGRFFTGWISEAVFFKNWLVTDVEYTAIWDRVRGAVTTSTLEQYLLSQFGAAKLGFYHRYGEPESPGKPVITRAAV